MSELFVARGPHVLGAIAVADTVRPDGPRTVEALNRLGLRTLLLTADATTVAERVARQLGIRGVAAELLPEQKRQRIRTIVGSGQAVAMVGDGINDAPALAEATVGIAMGSGTEVARESADVVLLGNDLTTLAETLALARRTRATIWQNFAGTITIDVVGVGLAAFGWLNPLLAAFIHVASELVFLLNSARLLPPASRRGQTRLPSTA